MSTEQDTARRSFEEARDAVRAPLWTLVRRHARPYLHYLALGALATFAFFFVGMVPNYLVAVAFDGVLTQEAPFHLPLVPDAWIPDTRMGQLLLTVGLFAAVGLTQAGAKMTREWALRGFALRLQHDLRVRAYDEVQHLETAFFDDHQTGEVMSILNYDVNQLEEFFTNEVNDTLQLLAIVSGLLVFMSLLNWQLMLVILAFGPIIFLGNYWFSGVIETIHDEIHASVAALNARLQNNVGGIATIKTFGRESYESERVEEASSGYFRSQWNAIRLNALFWPSMTLTTHATFLATFVVGGYWILVEPPLFFTEPLTTGALIAFLLYTQELRWPMTKITAIIDRYKGALASAKRVVGVQEAAMTILEAPDPAELGEVRGAVAFDDVWFAYARGGDPVIRGVSFTVEPGESIGIVGPTGAGKTTLMKLLLRLYDIEEGAIQIDGVDIRDVSLRELRRTIGYISQEPFLFSGTVAENIAYGTEAVDDDAIVDAAKLAGAHEFVEQLPDGYDTTVGERGVKLSGGQRQRLSIARAFVRDPPILVMDEATSHVDNETEVLIQRGIQSLIRDRTAFTIAHRLSTVRDADRIFVLDDGELRETGSHDALLEAGGIYANLWNLQVGAYDALSEEFVERALDLDRRTDD